MASKTMSLSLNSSCCCSILISNDMDPGPAIMGMASGVNAMESLVKASSFTRLSIPLCFVNLPVSNAKPEEAIIKPPAMRKESKEIPKKESMNFPPKKLMNKITHTLSPVSNAVLCCSELLLSLVSPTNMGTVPSGFVIENNEAKDKKKISNMIFNFVQNSVFKLFLKASSFY